MEDEMKKGLIYSLVIAPYQFEAEWKDPSDYNTPIEKEDEYLRLFFEYFNEKMKLRRKREISSYFSIMINYGNFMTRCKEKGINCQRHVFSGKNTRLRGIIVNEFMKGGYDVHFMTTEDLEVWRSGGNHAPCLVNCCGGDYI